MLGEYTRCLGGWQGYIETQCTLFDDLNNPKSYKEEGKWNHLLLWEFEAYEVQIDQFVNVEGVGALVDINVQNGFRGFQ